MLHKYLELHLPSSSFHYLQEVLFSDGVLKNTKWILFLSPLLIFTADKQSQENGNKCLFHNPPATAAFIIYEEQRLSLPFANGMFPLSIYIVLTSNWILVLTCTWAEIYFFSFLGKIWGLITDVLTPAFQPGWDCTFSPHAVVSEVCFLLGGGEVCPAVNWSLPP